MWKDSSIFIITCLFLHYSTWHIVKRTLNMCNNIPDVSTEMIGKWTKDFIVHCVPYVFEMKEIQS